MIPGVLGRLVNFKIQKRFLCRWSVFQDNFSVSYNYEYSELWRLPLILDHLFCINGKETICCTIFFKKSTLCFICDFTLLNLFKVWASCCTTCRYLSCITLIWTQVNIKMYLCERICTLSKAMCRDLWKTGCCQVNFPFFLMLCLQCC